MKDYTEKCKTPYVSVVMPVYNVEQYVGKAIESILNQTFSEFEFIIVDDSSTDNTWNIIQSYSDKRITAIQNKNNIGNYPSRNKGMKLAKGKYIAVMDGDDIAVPERIEKQFLYLEANPDIIALGSDFITSQKKREGVMSKSEDLCFGLLRTVSILHPSLMVRTDIINSLGGYNEEYKYASDYNLFCSLALIGKIENLPDVLMIYRVHKNQISSDKKNEQEKYSSVIRKKYQKSFIDKYKSEEQDSANMLELSFPEIGLSVCYYTYAKHFNQDKYKVLADSTIDVLYKVITVDTPVCIDKGLCGLGCGLHYLIRNKMLDGNVDEVLEDIDNQIISALQKRDEKNKEYIQDIQLYLKYRILKSENKDSVRIKHITTVYNEFFNTDCQITQETNLYE